MKDMKSFNFEKWRGQSFQLMHSVLLKVSFDDFTWKSTFDNLERPIFYFKNQSSSHDFLDLHKLTDHYQ